MDSAGIIVFIAGLIAIALIIPILLDDSPSAFIENGLCTIFGSVGNTTCTSVLGNVTFVGLNGIDIIASESLNTIFWNFTGHGGGIGNTTIIVGETLMGDNTERLYAHLARGTAGDITFTFGTEPTEYQIRFHEFEDGGGMGGDDEYASWYSIAQSGFNPSASLSFSYYYTTEKVGNGEPFCMQVDLWEFTAEGGDLDDTIQASKGFCDYTPPLPDILEKANHVFNSTEHQIDPEDFLIFNLARFGGSNDTDTGDYKVYTSDPEITWNIP